MPKKSKITKKEAARIVTGAPAGRWYFPKCPRGCDDPAKIVSATTREIGSWIRDEEHRKCSGCGQRWTAYKLRIKSPVPPSGG